MVSTVNRVDAGAMLTRLLSEVEPCQQAVLAHPVHGQLGTVAALRMFMQSHVFAVWDNMLLLKTLQQRLTCVTTPWLPVEDAIAARLINEMILDEETEELRPGEYMSHAEFYILAMAELGAETQPIEQLMDGLRGGQGLEAALGPLAIPQQAKAFVLNTWEICQGPTPGIVAAFLLGREEIATPLFANILGQLDGMELGGVVSGDRLRAYCQRHVSVDEERHIPMAKALLMRICGDSTWAWQSAEAAAISTLMARQRLWDGVVAEIEKSGAIERF
jgi:hypothetical protein